MDNRDHTMRWIIVLLAGLSLSAVAACGGTGPKEKGEQKSGKPGWIGVMIQDVSESLAKRKHLTTDAGAYISDIIDDSPADSADLAIGDVVVQFAGKDVQDAADLTRIVRKTLPGTRTTVTVLRRGEKKTINITVGKAKEPTVNVAPMRQRIRVMISSGSLGMELHALNEQLGEYFGAPDNAGVLVERVQKDTPADRAGFKAGDVIVRVGKRTVDELEDIYRELRKYDEGDKVEFEVLRKGARKTLTVEIEENEPCPGPMHLFPGDFWLNEGPGALEENRINIERDIPRLENFHIDIDRLKRNLRENERELRGALQKTLRLIPSVAV